MAARLTRILIFLPRRARAARYIPRMQWHTTASRQGDTASAGLELLTSIEAIHLHPDLLLLFTTPHHAAKLGPVLEMLRTRFPKARLLGGTAGGVIGGGQEIESGPGISLVAARLPDVEIHAEWVPVDDPLDRLRDAPAADQTPAILAISDPWSQAPGPLLAALDRRWPGLPKIGGMLSGSEQPRTNRLLLDDRSYRTGSVVLTLHGDIRMETIVAQGCRPAGPMLPITRCDDNRLIEIDGRPAFTVLEQLLLHWPDELRQRFRRTPLLGLTARPATQPAERPTERLLTRNIIGVDRAAKALIIGGLLEPGTSLCFQLRDGQSARDDLDEQLTRQARQPRPAPVSGVLDFSCQGRGASLFHDVNHESLRAFHHFQARPGGFFCSGEIGFIHGRSHLHGYTSSMGLFSPQGWD